MTRHRIMFVPSGRSLVVDEGETILDAALRCSEPLAAECRGGGACGRCLVRIVEGEVPDYRILRYTGGQAEVLACLTPAWSPLTVLPLVDAELPQLVSRDRNIGVQPLVDGLRGRWVSIPFIRIPRPRISAWLSTSAPRRCACC